MGEAGAGSIDHELASLGVIGTGLIMQTSVLVVRVGVVRHRMLRGLNLTETSGAANMALLHIVRATPAAMPSQVRVAAIVPGAAGREACLMEPARGAGWSSAA